MSRAISIHGRYELQLIEAPVKRGLDQSGNVVEYADGKPVNAQFAKTGLTEHEQLAALEHFSFSGLPEGVNPLSTISVWDSEAEGIRLGWSPEFQETIDKRLRHLATQNPGSVLVVDPPAKQSPWGRYDEQDVATIFRLFEATGADLEVVRLYEYENQGRQEIIEACEAITEGRATIQDFLTPEPTPEPEQALTAAPIVSGVASDQSIAPAKTDPMAAARAAKAAKAEANKGVIVDA